MADWDDFLTPNNFQLAWQRILRSRHYQNKDRIGLRVFEANLENNLQHLTDELLQGVYEPSRSDRIYVPKRAGTLRSQSVLTIRDRLVYQAIGNVLALRTKDTFEAITEGHVFAHLLSTPDDVFMLRRWDGRNGQYRRFLRRFREYWERGSQWIVEADIASYYDSVDHELLCNELIDRWGIDSTLVDLLSGCLRAWTPHEKGKRGFSRGLPQGYETSDYLSTLFLFPTDEHSIQRGSFGYIRYVDDIRILAQDRDAASRALIELDMSLKTQALILQPDKTGARKVLDIDTEIDKLINTLSMLDLRKKRGQDIDEEAEELFFKSWHKLDEDERAESHLIFALNRLTPSRPTRNVALKMLQVMPHRSDNVTGFLSKFEGDSEVIDALLNEVNTHRVYAWHLANCLRALSKIGEIAVFRDVCRSWVSNRSLPWYQRLAAVESLQFDHDSYSFLYLNCQQEQNQIVKSAMLVAAMFAASSDTQRAAVIRHGISDTTSQTIGTAIWLFLEFPDCGVQESEFGPELGVHRQMIPSFSATPAQSISFVAKALTDTFGVSIPTELDFGAIFFPDYEEAVALLRRALRYHDTDPVAFVTSIDNFNQIIAIKMSETLDGKRIPRNQYGNILGSLRPGYSVLSGVLEHCHDLRCRSRGPHAWATSLGKWSQEISHRQKTTLVQQLGGAYQQFIDAFAEHQGISP